MNSKKIAKFMVFGLFLSLLTACGGDSKSPNSSSSTAPSSSKKKVDLNKLDLPQLDEGVSKDQYLVKLRTTEGAIELKLFPKQAPKAVENFVTHAKKDYYNGTIFHRVIKEFMIQGGDPKGDGTGGESIWGGKGFKNEISNQLYSIRGALSMANAGPGTNGSQFYIVQNDEDQSDGLLLEEYPKKIIKAYKKGGFPDLDGSYTIFGQVTTGMDIVDKIANAEVKEDEAAQSASGGSPSSPVNPVKIEGIDILQKPSKK